MDAALKMAKKALRPTATMGDNEREKNEEACYELFCEAGMWKKALEEAVKLGDGRKIANVRSMCNSPDIQRLCDKYMT